MVFSREAGVSKMGWSVKLLVLRNKPTTCSPRLDCSTVKWFPSLVVILRKILSSMEISEIVTDSTYGSISLIVALAKVDRLTGEQGDKGHITQSTKGLICGELN